MREPVWTKIIRDVPLSGSDDDDDDDDEFSKKSSLNRLIFKSYIAQAITRKGEYK